MDTEAERSTVCSTEIWGVVPRKLYLLQDAGSERRGVCPWLPACPSPHTPTPSFGPFRVRMRFLQLCLQDEEYV